MVALYNSSAYIEDTLLSLQQQEHTNWRCIVVDDCSPDDSAQLVRAFAEHEDRVSLLSRETNGGQCAARNTGLAALGDDVPFVVFLDGDDSYLPSALSTLLAALQAMPDAVGVFGLAEYMDAAGDPVQAGRHPARQRDRRVWDGRAFTSLAPGLPSHFDDLVVYNPAWPPSVALLRTGIVRAVGGFDPAMVLREDWDLFVRMSRHGAFGMLDEQVVRYRRHDTNLTKDRVVNDRQHAAVMRKIAEDPSNTPAQRRVVRHLHRRQLLTFAAQMLRRSRALLREHEYRNAAAIAAAAGWTVALSARRLPPRPGGRRIPLSYAGHADEPWEA